MTTCNLKQIHNRTYILEIDYMFIDYHWLRFDEPSEFIIKSLCNYERDVPRLLQHDESL